MQQAVRSQGEDRGPTTCRGWGCALGTGVTCWEPAEKFPKSAVMEIVCTCSMGQEEGASQIHRSLRDGKKYLGKQKGWKGLRTKLVTVQYNLNLFSIMRSAGWEKASGCLGSTL